MDDSNDQFDEIVPLKRNHACRQCKARKVKCDATRPSCSPCLRSHAHALRHARRNNLTLPILCCTYPEGDDDMKDSPGSGNSEPVKHVERKKVVKKQGHFEKSLIKEKEIRREEDKETLLARIAQLESRLSNLQPIQAVQPIQNIQPVLTQSIPLQTNLNHTWPQPLQIMDITPPPQNIPDTLPDWDFGGLFLVPTKWPKNLPSPVLLDHLVETFFACVPQLPRILHKPTLLARIKLPPTHRDFPQPALLHAICASAASHTAWVNTLPSDQVEAARTYAIEHDLDLETMLDFGTAQAECASRCIHYSAAGCEMSPSLLLYELTQAAVILTDVYFCKRLVMSAWIVSGIPARLINFLAMANRNKVNNGKPDWLPAAVNDAQREERRATVWMTFLIDVGLSQASDWSQAINIGDLYCHLPTSSEDFNSFYMRPNPQTGHDKDVLTVHPVEDSFVLCVKAAILLSKVGRWLKTWEQRDLNVGNVHDAMQTPDFQALNADIFYFQLSVPTPIKNLHKLLEFGTSDFTNILTVHFLPQLAIATLHEPFIDWQSATDRSMFLVERACQSALGLVHLIPSNVDISKIITPMLVMCLYTFGRILAKFMKEAFGRGDIALGMRRHADVSTIRNVVVRYGEKQPFGIIMAEVMKNYLDGVDLSDSSKSSCLPDSYSKLQHIDSTTSFELYSGSDNTPSSTSKTTPESTNLDMSYIPAVPIDQAYFTGGGGGGKEVGEGFEGFVSSDWQFQFGVTQ